MRRNKLRSIYKKQDDEFLRASIPKLKKDVAKAIEDNDEEAAKKARTHLRIVKSILSIF